MQRSAGRPTVSASARVRPLSSSTRWNADGPSPRGTPVQSDVYGFMRSPVDERGRSWRKTSRSCHVSITFSIPITVISVSGRVVHMRPLPSDSTTQIVPVSATAKLAPEIATRARRNAARRWRRAASASSAGSSDRSGELQPLAEEIADLGTVLVDRRHEQVAMGARRRAGRSARRDRSRSAAIPARSRASLSRISSVASDLTFTTSAAPVAAHEVDDDVVRLVSVECPVHDTARVRHRGLELDEHLVQTWPVRRP